MIKIPQIKNAFLNWRELSLLKVMKYVSFIIGAIIITCLLVFVFFPDPFINAFLKNRVTKTITETYPAYSIKLGDMHYNIWKNRLTCDSIMLKSNDSTFVCSAVSFSISGISWMRTLLQGGFTSNSIKNSAIDVQEIVLNFRKKQAVLRFGKLRISVPDSGITVDSIKYFPLISDGQFFAKSQFRQTRFRFDIPQIKILSLDCLSLLQGNSYKAGSININNVFVDILVNMDKPYNKNSTKPQMPNEFLSSMKEIVKVDSLKIINGRLKYCEQYDVKASPGVITFDKVNISVRGIANHTDHPVNAVIHGKGIFMNSGTMKLFMAIPLASKNFSLKYSGSLSEMDVTKLNSFIVPTEHHRIKSGVLQCATYNIDVKSGQASGALRVVYKDLSIAVLNKKTGSENGVFDQISTLIGKLFIIRGTNMLNKNGSLKIGEIKYTRDPDDYFLQFVWFALRSGLGDVVGF